MLSSRCFIIYFKLNFLYDVRQGSEFTHQSSYPHRYPVVPAPYLENTILSLLESPITFILNSRLLYPTVYLISPLRCLKHTQKLKAQTKLLKIVPICLMKQYNQVLRAKTWSHSLYLSPSFRALHTLCILYLSKKVKGKFIFMLYSLGLAGVNEVGSQTLAFMG